MEDLTNRIAEAEEFERAHATEIAKNRCTIDEHGKIVGRSLPKHQIVLLETAKKWLSAKNYEKAEDYFIRAGDLEDAARRFEEEGDLNRARKFWSLAGKNPTGYQDEFQETSGDCFLKAGEIYSAINSYADAIYSYILSDGSRDSHGDDRPGIENALSLLNKVWKIKRAEDARLLEVRRKYWQKE
ncbi:MAG: hypothetical protein WCI72_02885 [archaeon]